MHPTLTERGFQKQVVALARLCGCRVAHFRAARIQRKDGGVYHATAVDADAAGYPDLTIVHPRRGVLWVELKVGGNRPTPEQDGWLGALAAAGGRAVVWTPPDWPAIEAFLLGDLPLSDAPSGG